MKSGLRRRRPSRRRWCCERIGAGSGRQRGCGPGTAEPLGPSPRRLLESRRTDAGQRGRLAHARYAHVQRRQWAEAIADLSKAIERQPDRVQAWSSRSKAHAELRQWSQAEADASKAMRWSATTGRSGRPGPSSSGTADSGTRPSPTCPKPSSAAIGTGGCGQTGATSTPSWAAGPDRERLRHGRRVGRPMAPGRQAGRPRFPRLEQPGAGPASSPAMPTAIARVRRHAEALWPGDRPRAPTASPGSVRWPQMPLRTWRLRYGWPRRPWRTHRDKPRH